MTAALPQLVYSQLLPISHLVLPSFPRLSWLCVIQGFLEVFLVCLAFSSCIFSALLLRTSLVSNINKTSFQVAESALWHPLAACKKSAGKLHEIWHHHCNYCEGSVKPSRTWMQARFSGSCNMFPDSMISSDWFPRLQMCLLFYISSNWTDKRSPEKWERPLLCCLDQKCFLYRSKGKKLFLRSHRPGHIKYWLI